eukprot:g8691.t1
MEAVVRRSLFFQHHVVSGLFVERFVSNLLMLGFLHELHFQHFGVNSACVRLEKRAEQALAQENEEAVFRAFSLRTTEKRNFLQGFASEGQWSKCAEVAESEEIDPEEETPLRLEEGLEPSRPSLLGWKPSQAGWALPNLTPTRRFPRIRQLHQSRLSPHCR